MRKNITSHVSIMGLFATLVIILAIPLIVFSTQQNQDIRQRAAGLEVSPTGVPQELGYISGYVYRDLNQNGQREPNEPGVPQAEIKVTQFNTINTNTQDQIPVMLTSVYTDENGYFKYQFPESLLTPASFSVQLILPAGFKTINSNPQNITNIQKGTKDVLEFGIFPLQTSPILTNHPYFTPPSHPAIQSQSR